MIAKDAVGRGPDVVSAGCLRLGAVVGAVPAAGSRLHVGAPAPPPGRRGCFKQTATVVQCGGRARLISDRFPTGRPPAGTPVSASRRSPSLKINLDPAGAAPGLRPSAVAELRAMRSSLAVRRVALRGASIPRFPAARRKPMASAYARSRPLPVARRPDAAARRVRQRSTRYCPDLRLPRANDQLEPVGPAFRCDRREAREHRLLDGVSWTDTTGPPDISTEPDFQIHPVLFDDEPRMKIALPGRKLVRAPASRGRRECRRPSVPVPENVPAALARRAGMVSAAITRTIESRRASMHQVRAAIGRGFSCVQPDYAPRSGCTRGELSSTSTRMFAKISSRFRPAAGRRGW